LEGDTSRVRADSLSLVFRDFNRGYLVVDRTA
jgi:predicted phage gp36 major capsid-like protein